MNLSPRVRRRRSFNLIEASREWIIPHRAMLKISQNMVLLDVFARQNAKRFNRSNLLLP
jgi:hypothetical protein